MKNFVKFCKDLKKKNIKYIYIKGNGLFANDVEYIWAIKLDFDISDIHWDEPYGLDYDRFILLDPKSKDDFEYKDGGIYIKWNFMENKEVVQVFQNERQENIEKIDIKDWKRLDFVSQIVCDKHFSPILTYVCLRNGTAYGTDSYEIREASDVYEGGEDKDYLIELKAFKYGEIETIKFWDYGTVNYKDSDFMFRYKVENPGKYPDIDYDRISGTETRKHITRWNELPEYKGKFDWLAFNFDPQDKRLKVYGIKGTDKIKIGETAMFWEDLESFVSYDINYKYWNEKKLKWDFTYEMIETNQGAYMRKRQHGVKTLIRVMKNPKFSI